MHRLGRHLVGAGSRGELAEPVGRDLAATRQVRGTPAAEGVERFAEEPTERIVRVHQPAGRVEHPDPDRDHGKQVGEPPAGPVRPVRCAALLGDVLDDPHHPHRAAVRATLDVRPAAEHPRHAAR